MKLRHNLYIVFGVLILILIVDFLINRNLSEKVHQNSNYLRNSEAIIRNSNLIHKNMISMQSGFRGFLLTGQSNFLGAYYSGLKTVPTLIQEQKSLFEIPRQGAILDSIVRLHRKWIQHSDQLILTRNDTVNKENKRYRILFDDNVRSEIGKKLNDSIAVLFNRFDEIEYAVRNDRRIAFENSINDNRVKNFLLTILYILIAVASGLYIIHLVTRRISTMVLLAAEISKGNFISIPNVKNDELKELSESLNVMSQTLDLNFKELDQFAYVVSHDLKAPLRGIKNVIKWMKEDHGNEITPGIKSSIDQIEARTKRLENMINGLLEYARINKTRKDPEIVDTRQMVNDLVELLVPPSFSISIDADMPVVKTDKIKLEQVFSNLISNAVKYCDKKVGEITIRYKDLGNLVQFMISDNGTGIKAEYYEKIFVIFQTLKERDAFESTGVGLAIVKKIINDQKTDIYVESSFGNGSTFIFTWPKYPIN